NLVVTPGNGAFQTGGVEFVPQRPEFIGAPAHTVVPAHDLQDVRAFEIADGGHGKQVDDLAGIITEYRFNFGWRPDVELAFFAVGVSILRGIEPALGRGHFTGDIIERFPGDGPVELLPGDLESKRVRVGQLGVVVEHFLEVGY